MTKCSSNVLWITWRIERKCLVCKEKWPPFLLCHILCNSSPAVRNKTNKSESIYVADGIGRRHVCCHGNRQPFKNNTQQLLKMRENNYFSNIYINGQPCLLGILFIYLFLSFFNGENVCDWVCECLRARNVTFNCFFLSLTCPDGSRDLIPLSPLVGFYTESLRRNFVYYLLCGVSAPRIGTGTTGGGHLDFQYGRAHRHRKHHVACIHSLHIFEKT